MDNHFIKVTQKTLNTEPDKKFNIYIQSEWTPKIINFRFQETQTHKCYQAELTDHNLRKSAIELDIDYEEFRQECYDALTNFNVDALNFEYEINSKENCFKLWKNIDFMMVYLEIELKELKHPYEIFDNVIEQLNNQQINSTNVEATKSNVAHENLDKIIQEVNEFLNDRKTREFCLMAKFLRILNAKKEKIRQMGKIIEELNSKKEADVKNGCADDSFNVAVRLNHQNLKRATQTKILDDNDSTDIENNSDTLDGSPSTSNRSPTKRMKLSDFIQKNDDVDDADNDDDFSAETQPLDISDIHESA